MKTLFAELYGYWDPGPDWRRGEDSTPGIGTKFSELHHPIYGTLKLSRQMGMDDVPIVFSLVLPVRGEIFVQSVADLFMPPGHRLREPARWDHAASYYWETEPTPLEDTVVETVLSALFDFGLRRRR